MYEILKIQDHHKLVAFDFFGFTSHECEKLVRELLDTIQRKANEQGELQFFCMLAHGGNKERSKDTNRLKDVIVRVLKELGVEWMSNNKQEDQTSYGNGKFYAKVKPKLLGSMPPISQV